jgi:hypothetical protein
MSLTSRKYYSVRTGQNPLTDKISLLDLLRLLKHLFRYFEYEGYFQEYLGYECVDAGYIPGKLGHDMQGALLLQLRKSDLWPIDRKIDFYSEDDIFDIIEFLYEHCSQPVKRSWHSWSDCGWHCETFDKLVGQIEFREKVNKILEIYQDGFELSNVGEILRLLDTGLEPLFEAEVPSNDPDNITTRVEAAKLKFRRSRSSIEDRGDAIRDLAAVLEFLRPELKKVLTTQDESDLFNIANNFSIRHHNDKQKAQYDKPIWYSWLFYYYLATIHAALRLIARKKGFPAAVDQDLQADR